MMRAELDGVVCSGPRRGKQFTYALFEERVAGPTALERDAALFELARRYFTTRGPATVDDFSWWSGLAKADAKRSVEAAASQLVHMSIDGRSYWSTPGYRARRTASVLAHLLPNYDEYFIGLKDRSAFVARLRGSGVKARTDGLSGNVLIVDGQIVGGWRRTLAKGTAVIELRLLIRLREAERRAVAAAVKRFGDFLELAARIRWV